MEPWPPRAETLIGRMEIKTGQLALYFLPGPRLRALVTSPDGSVGEAVSGVLLVQPDTTFKMALSCGDDLDITLAASGQIIGRSDDAELYSSTFELKPVVGAGAISNLDERNEAARVARREVAGSRTPRRGRKAMPPEYAVTGLRREMAQVEDLLNACKAGQRHDLFGLAARLRLLIARGSTLHPLMQLVAGHFDLPIVVHALDHSIDAPEEGVSAMGSFSLQDKPGSNTMAVDLDVWLGLPGAAVEGKAYTNNDMVRAIGDTVGAHFDPDLEPLVEMLESMQSGTQIGLLSEFDRWVLSTAYGVKRAGEDLLSELAGIYSR